jgi:hypothetical protein
MQGRRNHESHEFSRIRDFSFHTHRAGDGVGRCIPICPSGIYAGEAARYADPACLAARQTIPVPVLHSCEFV